MANKRTISFVAIIMIIIINNRATVMRWRMVSGRGRRRWTTQTPVIVVVIVLSIYTRRRDRSRPTSRWTDAIAATRTIATTSFRTTAMSPSTSGYPIQVNSLTQAVEATSRGDSSITTRLGSPWIDPPRRWRTSTKKMSNMTTSRLSPSPLPRRNRHNSQAPRTPTDPLSRMQSQVGLRDVNISNCSLGLCSPLAPPSRHLHRLPNKQTTIVSKRDQQVNQALSTIRPLAPNSDEPDRVKT